MILYLLIGLVLGGALVYFWRNAATANLGADLRTAQEKHAQLTQTLAQQELAADRLLTETRNGYERRLEDERSTRERIIIEFKAAAGDTLKENSKQFLDAAIKDLRQVKTETEGSVGTQQKLISTSVGEMKERIDEIQTLVNKFEKERGEKYASLEQQLTQLQSAGVSWQSEAASLRTVLSKSTATIGNWGELVLRNIFAACNLVEGTNFIEQQPDPSGTLRPDFIVILPQSGHRQVIDAKTASLDLLLSAEQTTDPIERKSLETEFASRVKGRVRELAGKEYQKQIDPEVPYVVMFIPSEAAIRVALNADRDLFLYAMSNKIIIASPATIMPLLLLIARSWQQNEFAINAHKLGEQIEELGGRLAKFVDHLEKLSGAISNTIKHWNGAVGSWQSRVSPHLDKLRTLGAALPDQLSNTLESVSEQPRALRAPEEEAETEV